jgi:hypothetical protein
MPIELGKKKAEAIASRTTRIPIRFGGEARDLYVPLDISQETSQFHERPQGSESPIDRRRCQPPLLEVRAIRQSRRVCRARRHLKELKDRRLRRICGGKDPVLF